MVALAQSGIAWIRQSDGFYRSSCGRFDLMASVDADGVYWVAYDWDTCERCSHDTRLYVESWCVLQLSVVH